MERRLVGIPASPGVAVGPVHLLWWEVPEVRHRIIPDEGIPDEQTRFIGAVERSKTRLRQVRERVEGSAGPQEAAIFDVQLSILEDAELLTGVAELIKQNLAAEKAFDIVMSDWRTRFARHSHPMLRERVGDLTDVHIRVLTLLLGLPDHDPIDVPKGTNAIVVTHDLTPSLTVQLDREAIAGIATDAGTRTSHVAILARSLGLPAVVGLRSVTTELTGRERVIIDGSTGMLAINPSDEDIAQYEQRAREEVAAETELRELVTADAVTTDGVAITLRANVDLPEDSDYAAATGADGVGLMRTEFLVLGRAAMPDEDEQYKAYTKVVSAFHGRPVIIRTFDIGGDKLPIGGFPAEANPFLGWRAIRMCLDQPDMFRTQLRALMRAAVHGDVRILLPLVVSAEEVHGARMLLDEAADELAERGVEFRRDVPLGVMIETPAAAISAETLVDGVSFFSIGTNDLVQYTLAVDRGNANLASRFTPTHPAVLQLIRRTVEVGHEHDIEVAVCGEMGSHPLLAFALLGLGVREMSVTPRSVLVVKRMIRSVSVEAARAAVEAALKARTAADAEFILAERIGEFGIVTRSAQG
ncbi:MAG: phosphoenolpyruvate--protein phosphotransferase [Gemmatimonadaceae bacterium]|nr:phosphoenolpyruvate--protein phosphotransferase [Gemmatimonadaceae bacterium]